LTTPSDTAVGKVRWKRFAALMIPAGIATGGLLYATATGALASSFAISGQNFTVSADSIDGTHFEQYGSTVKPAGKSTTPVAISGMSTATIKNLCQSVSGPFGITMKLTAGTGSTPVTAKNLVLSVSDLTAKKATFSNINIGQDDTTLAGPQPGTDHGFGQQASKVHLEGVKQTAWATTAGTFNLPDLKLGFNFSGDTCG
jgi:hypothetical protein